MKILQSFLAVVVILLLIGFVFTGIDDARQKAYTQTAPLTLTAVAENSTEVTLLKDLFNDDITSVTAITSSLNTDAPAVSVYNNANNHLTVIGLTENATRTLSIAYTYARLTGAADGFMNTLPILIVVGLFIVVGLSWWAMKRGK